MAPSLIPCALVAALLCSASLAAQESGTPETRLSAVPSGAPRLVTNVFDVSELTGHARLAALRATVAEGAPDDHPDGLATLLDSLAAAQHDADEASAQLVTFVRAFVDPPLDEGTRQTIDWVRDGLLLVIGTPAQQDWVRDFLATQRDFDRAIRVRVRIVAIDDDELPEFGLDGGGVKIVPSAEADSLVAALVERHTLSVTSPTVLALPRQKANVSVQRQHTYVQGWELRVVEPDETKVADPVIGTIDEGTSFDVCGAPLHDGRLGLDVRYRESKLQQPLETMEAEIDPDLPALRFSLPVVESCEFWTQLELASDHAALLTLGDPHRLVVVEAESVSWEDAARDADDAER